MIEMTALISLYESLVDSNKLPAPGYSRQKISYAIDLEPETGKFNGLISMKSEVPGKTRTNLIPTLIAVPTPIDARTGSKPTPHFLWDNPTYLLGITQEGKDAARTPDCFAVEKRYHHKLLDAMDGPIVHAILNFFDAWDLEEAEDHPLLQPYKDDLLKGCNLIFCVGGVPAHDDPEIRVMWQKFYDQDNDPVMMQSLVSGKMESVARIHPKIMGVRGGQSTGTSLVSYNFPAACHYGKKQSFNAPMSKYESFAYTAAINYLLADGRGVNIMGKTTVLCWSEGADEVYQQFLRAALFDEQLPEDMTEEELVTSVRMLAEGKPVEKFGLFPDKTFYMLGIDPNAGRLAVRFFLENSFGSLMKNVSQHYDRLVITKPEGAPPLHSVFLLMRETVRKPSKSDKNPPQINPGVAAQMANAIIKGTKYPSALPTSILVRIRADKDVYWTKAAILKAYYLNNHHPGCPEEICTPTLNEQSTYVPYILGRLFAMYESLQFATKRSRDISFSSASSVSDTEEKGGKKKKVSSIRERYLNSAAVTPNHIFGVVLDRLADSYIKTMARYNEPLSNWFKKQLQPLKDIIGYDMPIRLNNAEQAAFYLGYYHQKKSSYTKTTEENDSSEDEI